MAMPNLDERRAILQKQPQTKWIDIVHNDGTKFPVVKRHLVQMHQTKVRNDWKELHLARFFFLALTE